MLLDMQALPSVLNREKHEIQSRKADKLIMASLYIQLGACSVFYWIPSALDVCLFIKACTVGCGS